MIIGRHDCILFLGDSLTQRTGLLSSTNPAVRYGHPYLGSYVDILLPRLLVHYPHLELQTCNAGIGGIMLPQLLQKLSEYLAQFEPTRAVLFMGQNDAKKYGSEEFENYLRQVLDELRGNQVEVLQLSTTPHPGEDRKNQSLAVFDRIIEKLCNEFSNHFLDVKTPFEKVQAYNESARRPIQLFSDGCHMSALGNQLLADLVFNALTDT